MMTEHEMEKQIERWLRNYKSIKSFIDRLQKEIDSRATECMGNDTTRESVSKTYKFNSVVENAVIDDEKENEAVKENMKVIKKIDLGLNTLNEMERKVIENHCIDSMFYYQFSFEIGLSERSCKRIKKRAIVKMRQAIYGI